MRRGVIGVATGLYRLLARLMPERFRQMYLGEALGDLEDELVRVLERRGRFGVVWAALAALGDLAGRIPREWMAEAGRARRRHGGYGRESGRTETMRRFWSDIRLAARALVKRPGYGGTAVATLALGIGANVAIFTVVNAVLLRPLPYPDAEGLITVRHHAPGLDLPDLNNSDGTLNFYRDEAPFIAALAGFDDQRRNLVGGAEAERVEVIGASPEIFEILRVRPFMGRPLVAADAEEGAPPVMILTHASWVTRFGGDPGVVGRTLQLDGIAHEVVGVMPEGFAFPDRDPVAFVPLHVDPDGEFGTFGTTAIGRLAEGVGLEAAAQRARDLQGRLPEYFPDLSPDFLEGAGWGVTLEPFQDWLVERQVASALWVVLGTVGFVLLIACANVANLFLVRAESRQKEMAIRAAMGAGRGAIARTFLSEALLLGALGGLVGVLFAWLGVDLLLAYAPEGLPRIDEVAMDNASLAFAGILSLAAGLALGSMPIVRLGVGGVGATLRDGGRGTTEGRGRHRTRNTLVAGQLALALVLLVGSGLMLRSFQALRHVDPGIDPDGVLTVGLSLGDGVPREEAARFYATVADEVASLPGVTSVGLTNGLPVAGNGINGGSFYIESQPREEGDLPPVARYKAIGADYLEALRQPLLEGRRLQRSDWETSERAVLVNETFARTFLDGRALGEGIRFGGSPEEYARVVGVVADVRESGLDEEILPMAYFPMIVGSWHHPELDRLDLVVRAEEGMALPLEAIRRVVRRLDAGVPITTVQTMHEVLAEDMAGTSFTMTLLGIAALMALFLGAIGLFGVISYVVAQRTREIGVRVALGARGADIRGLVLRQGARVTVAGVVLGLLGAGALSRVMATLLYGVSTTDPWSFVGAPLVLGAVVVTATWLPARRAARVDPIEALRAE